MAHGITQSDKIVLNSGVKAWHGLGEVIDQALSPSEAVRKVLNWEPEAAPILFQDRRPQLADKIAAAAVFLANPTDQGWSGLLTATGLTTIAGYKANVRDDNQEPLGVVSDQYKIVPNRVMGSLAESLVGADAAVQVETCGSLLGGRRVFMLCRIPQALRVGTGGADVSIPYLCLSNTHDGTGALFGMWTAIRVVCNNTLGFALGANFEMAEQAAEDGRAFRFRHTGEVMDRVEEARRALKIATTMTERFQILADELARTQMKGADLEAYFQAVYIGIYGPRPTDPKLIEKAEAWNESLKARRAEWGVLFENEKQKLAGIEGSAWAALNAVTEWHDHKRSGGRVAGDRRQHSNLFGSSARDKRGAIVAAVEFLRGKRAAVPA